MFFHCSSLIFWCVIFSTVKALPRPLLLVSFDGFRYDYMTLYNASTFKKLATKGVLADEGYYPAFPSSTFPCHYTLVTGLHPESHGIVYNRMYDPEFKEIFTLANIDTKWFDGGEPIWITTRLEGLNSACFFWPGSQTILHNTTANHYKNYNKTIPFKERVDGIVKWLSEESISFATLYFEQPDQAGHQFGPLSPEVASWVKQVDETLQYLLDKLTEVKLIDNLNLIVTSDHGMAKIEHDNKHVLYLQDVLKPEDYDLIPQIGTVAAVWPKPNKTEIVYKKLVNHGFANVTVYRKEDIPERFHYSKHRRIMPIVLIADEGYITLQNITQLPRYGPGQHGYDNRLPTMRPIFIASGPDFQRDIKVKPFDSVHVYPLMCHLLGIEPRPNNGSLEAVRSMLANEATSSSTGGMSYMMTTLTVLYMVGKDLMFLL